MVILTQFSEASSSSSPPSHYIHDVFLSFQGGDTRHSFTDHLYKALVDANIDTFLDDENIQTGEDLKPELENAIKASRSSIIVLSQNYASSTWCLDELVLILEQRAFGHLVIPIFYHVEPTDVRKQQNSFGDALAKHKRRMEAETDMEKRNQWAEKIELWKKALTEIASLKGEDANGRRETTLIEEIIRKISRRLDLHLRREIPRLIGMKSSIITITSFLKDGSSQTTGIFTLWGMAGIGKTSLAKYIYQLHYGDFEKSSFLEGIERRCTQSSALLDLQKKLLKDIQDGSLIDIHDVDVCTFKIEKSLLRKKTLLVLDGIDHFKQLDVLVGTKGLFPGSRIIITTKDGSLTEKCRLFETQVPPNHTKHLLKGLDEWESLQLLSWHAFGGNDPKKGYEEESRRVVEYCGGHPLALEVLGSSLRKEDVAKWHDTLVSLEKKSDPDIKKVLQISFESLPSEKDKELFKYIACFFVGKDREFTEEILKACDICQLSGIKNLINRCLLTIGSEKKLMMHQLLQDMGRDIVHQESPKPWKRSLLWHKEEFFQMLKVNKGTIKLQGLALDMKTFENEPSHRSIEESKQKFGDDFCNIFKSFPLLQSVLELILVIWYWLFCWVSRLFSSFHRKKCGFETDIFSKMCNLRFLQLNYVQLNGSYKNFPHGLRWLCMHGFPLCHIPSDLHMENMVGLDMSYSNLQQLWKKPKTLGSLKFLNLSYCDNLVRVGHFSKLPVLERLILKRCVSLIEVCDSIGNCDRLVLLDVSGCIKLKRLPGSIGKLKNLRTLSIDGCANLGEVKVEVNDMELLEVPKANNNNIKAQASTFLIVKDVPRCLKSSAIFLPCSLVSLTLINNKLVNESFPKDFSSLLMLENLYLDGNPIDSLPDCVRSLCKLKHLSLHNCEMLKSVLCTPRTLKELRVSGCFSLKKITFHQDESIMPYVSSILTKSLTEIEGRFKMEAIAEIDEEILCSLGWKNLEYVEDNKMHFHDRNARSVLEELPVQMMMIYEHGIFNTFFQGKEVPNWLTYKSKGSTISFTLQSCLRNRRIQGFNVCFVYKLLIVNRFYQFCIRITNLTKSFSWCYLPRIDGVGKAKEEGMVWLSHWMFGNNEFEDGDEVCCAMYDDAQSHTMTYIYEKEIDIIECGISVMYDDGKKREDDPLAYYKSWKYRIGGDVSPFQETSGNQILIRDNGYNSWVRHKEELTWEDFPGNFY